MAPPTLRVESGAGSSASSRAARSVGYGPLDVRVEELRLLGMLATPGLGPRLPGLPLRRPSPPAPRSRRRARRRARGSAGDSGHPSAFLVASELLLAERRAVRRGGAGLLGRTVPDDGLHADEARPRELGLGRGDGPVDAVEVVALHRLDLPAVGLEPPGHVLAGEREGGPAVDGDAVVVVQADETPEPVVAGEAGRLGGDALHHVAVPAGDVDEVVLDRVARAEPGREHGLPEREARPRSRRPGRAGRWCTRPRGAARTPGAPACASGAGGRTSGRRACSRSRPGAGASRGASSRGRRRG